MELGDVPVMPRKPGRGHAPLAIASFFMGMRCAKLHRPERPGRGVGALGRRLRQQFELMDFDTALPVAGTATVPSGIASPADHDAVGYCRERTGGSAVPDV